jgi:hypothetical protein
MLKQKDRADDASKKSHPALRGRLTLIPALCFDASSRELAPRIKSAASLENALGKVGPPDAKKTGGPVPRH